MNRKDLTEIIHTPMYNVNGYMLNEYEVRNLMLRISKRLVNPKNINLTDSLGQKFTFDKQGNIEQTTHVHLWDLADRLAMEKFIQINKNK